MSNSPFNPFEFLTASWGNLGNTGFPQSGLMTTDPAELDKRIQEMKAVEQWLSFNLQILKTTIQGLEVQRGTLAAIQSFSDSMGKTATAKPGAAEESATENPQDPASQWWGAMQQQFGQMMQAAQASSQAMTASTPNPEDTKAEPKNEK